MAGRMVLQRGVKVWLDLRERRRPQGTEMGLASHVKERAGTADSNKVGSWVNKHEVPDPPLQECPPGYRSIITNGNFRGSDQRPLWWGRW